MYEKNAAVGGAEGCLRRFYAMNMKKMLAVVAAATLAATPALAANPFSDVPQDHWAYEAVERLAASGALSGYPDGAFRGGKPMTRYEIAVLVARAMAGGSGGDELKALTDEFAPELKALGVRVDEFDGRLSKMEKNLGGWQISGEMQFDYNNFKGDLRGGPGEVNGFEFDSARLFLHRDLADGVSFSAEYGDGTIDRYWIEAQDFLGSVGLTFKAGQFDIDFEGDDGLYYDEHEDAGLFMGLPYRGVQLTQDFVLGEFSAFAASNVADDGISVYDPNEGGEYYGLRLKFNFGEKIWLSGNYYISKPGEDAQVGVAGFKTWWVGAGYKFGPGIELKGAFYGQSLDEPTDTRSGSTDDPKAWKAVLNVDQETLKFTSAWLEYAHFDAGFLTENTPYAFHGHTADLYGMTNDAANVLPSDSDVLFAALKQEWGEKWSTFERFAHWDFDGMDSVKDWAVGVGYQYTPNVYFELAYNRIDVGDQAPGFFEKGDIVRFRTLVSF